MRETTATDRDRALRRLGRATSITLAAAGALAAAFAGLAARALPGQHTAKITNAAVRTTQHRATAPPLVPAQSAASPAAAASPPVQTQAAPVATSGGT